MHTEGTSGEGIVSTFLDIYISSVQHQYCRGSCYVRKKVLCKWPCMGPDNLLSGDVGKSDVPRDKVCHKSLPRRLYCPANLQNIF